MIAFPHLFTGSEMAAIDRQAIEDGPLGATVLMERAGARVVETLQARWGGLEGLRIAVVCGKGNNGGDGFVIARLLAEHGVAVDTYVGVEPTAIEGEAAELLQRLEGEGVQPLPLPVEAGAAIEALRRCDIIVDALLGTGLQGAPRAPQARIIQAINDCTRPVLSVDIPSGVNANNGQVEGVAVQAAVSVTFGLAKIGHLFPPGRAYCGVLERVDIGFQQSAIDACGGMTYLLTAAGIARSLPRRRMDAHKGTCGSVLVIAGAAGMTGAATLASLAALRAGAGRVNLGAPASLHDILEMKLTEAMTRPLPEVRQRRCLSLRALGDILALMPAADALAIGPGLGRYRETTDLVRRLLARSDLPPTVIDADALYAIGDGTGFLRQGQIITPHMGEFSRLTGNSREELAANPVRFAVTFAQRHGVIVVLKGGPSIVASPDGRAFVNPTGNPGMATAGSGDVLTGILTGLLAQGCDALCASLCAVYLHGVAGDRAREELGESGMLASDLLQQLPAAFVDVITP